MAKGIVGSYPYFVPELLMQIYYDSSPHIDRFPIMYYCMFLKWFPWKRVAMRFRILCYFCEKPDDTSGYGKDSCRILRLLPMESRNLIEKMF